MSTRSHRICRTNRAVLRGLLLGFLGLVGSWLAEPGWAQPAAPAARDTLGIKSPVPEEPTLVIESNPAGAIVTLRGDYEWVGQTPWKLFRAISGTYAVEARRPGYETWRGQAVLGPGGVRELKITLSRKSEIRALGRSILVPGWGQVYEGSRGKGVLMMSAAAVAGAGLIWTHELYRDRVDQFDQARTAFEQADQLGAQWDKLRADLDRASQRADRAYERRKLALGVTAGVYLLSVVDLLVFSSAQGPETVQVTETAPGSDPAGPSAGQIPERPGLGWNLAFNRDSAVRAGLAYRW
jgi:hypothetical protein